MLAGSGYHYEQQRRPDSDFDATSVKETELDPRVSFTRARALGVSVRGKIDWVIDLDGPVARLADLKTVNELMARWGFKADGQLQATAYGYAGKPRLLLRRHPHGERQGRTAPPLNTTAQRNERHYRVFEDTRFNFVRSTDVLNNHEGFIPFPNPEPNQNSHCGSCVTSRRKRRNSCG